MLDRDLGPHFDVDRASQRVDESFNGRYVVIYDKKNTPPDFAEREQVLRACIESNNLTDKVQILPGFPPLGMSLISAEVDVAQRVIEVCSPPIKALMPDQRIYDPDRPHALVDQRPKQDIF